MYNIDKQFIITYNKPQRVIYITICGHFTFIENALHVK